MKCKQCGSTKKPLIVCSGYMALDERTREISNVDIEEDTGMRQCKQCGLTSEVRKNDWRK